MTSVHQRLGFTASAVLQRPALINDSEIVWKQDIHGTPYLSLKKILWDLDDYFFTIFLTRVIDSVSGSDALLLDYSEQPL